MRLENKVSGKKTGSKLSAKPADRSNGDFFGGDDLRQRIFMDKYALRDKVGKVVENSPIQMWHRVAQAISSAERTDELKDRWKNNFFWLLSDFRFIPGGRILFGAGSPRNATLLNCYVVPVKSDSLEGIFEWMKEAARTYSYGGGVGTDISVLRPRGANVNNAALTSTGSVSFMDLFSMTTGTIGQSGRRGALMITMRDSHPDILDFVKVKRNLNHVRYANISVRISDKLMKAVEEDASFDLVFESDKVQVKRTIRAKDLWDELVQGAHQWAEPGIIFWDNVQRESTSEYNGMEVIGTNPCSEIPLEGYGACCLGNLNLSKFVLGEFTDGARVNWEDLEKAARHGIRFLDDVLDYNASKHPLSSQSDASLNSRRIGLGFTGLGDMLCQLRLKYDTDQAISFVDSLFDRIKHIAYDESVNLAIEKGIFPNYDKDKHLQAGFFKRLDPKLVDRVAKHGIRNVALLTVPPVGSGAALAGTTSGVEPIFDISYTRRSESLSSKEFKVYHPLVAGYMKEFGLKDEAALPDYFIVSHKITAEKRVLMQATIQRHIDHAISSTVNLPREATPEDVGKIYMNAWKTGCKGITVYREGSREGILISDKETKLKENTPPVVPGPDKPALFAQARHRPKMTDGRTEKLITPRGPIYVTINEDEFGLHEVFVRSLDLEAEVTGRLVSLLLRTGVDPREIIEQLWSVRTREVSYDKSPDGTNVMLTTVSQGIALAMGRYLYGDGFNPHFNYPRASTLPETSMPARQLRLMFKASPAGQSVHKTDAGLNGHSRNHEAAGEIHSNGYHENGEFSGVCPDCGESLVRENGCVSCKSCFYSRCG